MSDLLQGHEFVKGASIRVYENNVRVTPWRYTFGSIQAGYFGKGSALYGFKE